MWPGLTLSFLPANSSRPITFRVRGSAWLKPRVSKGCVVHSFRHSLRDRLRAVQCPSDMIDQIGGWAAAGVGQGYGEGYSLIKMSSILLTISNEQSGE